MLAKNKGFMTEGIELVLKQKLEKRKLRKIFRTLPQENSRIDFSSNDYLGFATQSLIQLDINQKISSGSGSSRLISGNSKLHEALEQLISAYHKAETGLIFNSGYDANIGLLGCIAQKGDTILYDEFSHASSRDGLKMSLATTLAFKHNDLENLESLLKSAEGNKIIVTEALFSMDGDLAPLVEMVELCEHYHADLIVDEAHSNGIIGKHGKGLVCELGLENKVLARVHTFGKALGCHGAIVLGSETLRNYLINYARSFIFTTAIPEHSLMVLKEAYAILSQTKRINILNQNIEIFHQSLSKSSKKHFLPSKSPIQSLIINGANKTREIAHLLQEQNFDVKPIVSPTVPLGAERIRICLHAFNKEEDITSLALFINKLLS